MLTIECREVSRNFIDELFIIYLGQNVKREYSLYMVSRGFLYRPTIEYRVMVLHNVIDSLSHTELYNIAWRDELT